MPSITPSYLYTLAAIITVASLLVLSFIAYSNSISTLSEATQLKNLIDYVAAKGTELLTFALATNATSEVYIQMPTTIGNKQYWLRLRNNSASAWLEGGFGNTPMEGTDLYAYLPKEASATGIYVGGYGAAYLKCSLVADVPRLYLSSSSHGD